MTQILEFEALARRIARSRLRREPDLRQDADAIANTALESLLRAMRSQQIKSPTAFLTWKIKHLIIDAGLSRNAELEHLKVHGHELRAIRVVDGQPVDAFSQGRQLRGLSLDIISKEERATLDLVAAAIVAIMPDLEDRKLLRDRFYEPERTIADLARRYGKRTPAALANHLKRILGTPDEPGAVECVSHVIRHLSLKTGRAFTQILMNFDDLNRLTDPFAAAIGHLEYMSMKSPSHRQLAARGIARLRWLEQHRPSNRGIGNKLLNRLITAGCFYVLELRDARHDEFDDMGLIDDVKVLDQIHKAIVRFSAA